MIDFNIGSFMLSPLAAKLKQFYIMDGESDFFFWLFDFSLAGCSLWKVIAKDRIRIEYFEHV